VVSDCGKNLQNARGNFSSSPRMQRSCEDEALSHVLHLLVPTAMPTIAWREFRWERGNALLTNCHRPMLWAALTLANRGQMLTS